MLLPVLAVEGDSLKETQINVVEGADVERDSVVSFFVFTKAKCLDAANTAELVCESLFIKTIFCERVFARGQFELRSFDETKQ